MGEATGGASFAEKTLAIFLRILRCATRDRDGFDCGQAVQHRVTSFIDRTHGAAAKHGNELVAAKAFLLVTGHDVTGDGLNVAWENARKTR